MARNTRGRAWANARRDIKEALRFLRKRRWFAANECDIVNTWNMSVRKRKGNGYVRSCTCDETIPQGACK